MSLSHIKAVILAGGKGQRLGELTRDLPKALVKIGDRPVLDHQLELLEKYGITQTLLLIGHHGQKIRDHIEKTKKPGWNIEFYQETAPLGTAGALKEVQELLTSDFLVIYGDVMINMDLEKLLAFHSRKKAAATLVVHPNNHPEDSDLVEVDENSKIIKVHPKPHDPKGYLRNLVSAGLYVMNPQILTHLRKGTSCDLARDVFPTLVKQENIFGYSTAEYLSDMGTPDRLKTVNSDYKSGKISRFHFSQPRKAVFLDRDGVINENLPLVSTPEQFSLLKGSAEAIAKLNQSEYLSIVVTNQPIIAKGQCTFETLQSIHNKMETLLGQKHAKLDAIYFCPHHPEKGHTGERKELKIDCGCRKPKDGMIQKALSDFSIRMDSSVLIGDSYRDILCGKNAGLTTIGVRSGNGCRDLPPEVEPDYFFDDLKSAVEFLLRSDLSSEVDSIIKKVTAKSGKKPLVIAIGGNSRSGKSTLARQLLSQLETSGKKALLVSLDHWIVPLEKRKEGGSVFDRYEIATIEADIAALISGKKIQRSPYSSLRRSTDKKNPISYQIKGEDILIVEGVVALSSKTLRPNYDIKVFCEISESDLKKRFMQFYSWKGLDAKESEKLFRERTENEYSLIAKDQSFADILVKNSTSKERS